MNNSNPFVPQGSSLWEQQKIKARARLRVAVFCTLSISILGLMALLIQGCRPPAEEVVNTETNTPPTFETGSNMVMDATTPGATTTSNTQVAIETPAPAMQEYTVMQGDTLSGIATKFGLTSWKAIQDANPGIEPTKLRPGMKLKIPPPPPPSATTTTVTPTAAPGEELYVVKSGDTLSGIATAKHTTVKALRAENNLTTDRIVVGQKLKIPKPAAPTTTTP